MARLSALPAQVADEDRCHRPEHDFANIGGDELYAGEVTPVVKVGHIGELPFVSPDRWYVVLMAMKTAGQHRPADPPQASASAARQAFVVIYATGGFDSGLLP
jgi:hypothetical protein